MRYVKFGLFAFMFLWFAGCITQPEPVPEPKKDYEKIIDEDEDRDDVLSEAKKGRVRSSPICEGDDDCEDLCSDIYRSRRERGDCEEFSIAQVERLDEIHDILEDPRLDDLEEIDVSENGDFDVYVNISPEPLEKLIRRYSQREVDDILIWIANYDDVARLFAKEDRDYDILKDLLGELNSDEFTALAEGIDGRDSFIDLAVVAGNEEAIDWILDFLDDENSDCSGREDERKLACLMAFCNLAEEIDDENAEELADFESFDDYLDDVIRGAVNGDTTTTTRDGNDRVVQGNPTAGQWDADEDSADYIEDTGDLDSEWWEDLCPNT